MPSHFPNPEKNPLFHHLLCLLSTSLILSLVSCEDVKCEERDYGYRHINNTLNTQLTEVIESYNSQFTIMKEQGDRYNITHGGSVFSKYADISAVNECKDMIASVTSVGLVCKDIFYLLDSVTYSRSVVHKLQKKEDGSQNSFRSYSQQAYSIILLSNSDTDKTVDITYINTFDSLVYTYHSGNGFLFQNISHLGGTPTIKYISPNSTNINAKFILFYDAITSIQTAAVCIGNSNFSIKITDPSGLPKQANHMNQVFSLKGEREEDDGKVSFYEIFIVDKFFYLFYRVHSKPDGQDSTIQVSRIQFNTLINDNKISVAPPEKVAFKFSVERFGKIKMIKHVSDEFILVYEEESLSSLNLTLCTIDPESLSIDNCTIPFTEYIKTSEIYIYKASLHECQKETAHNKIRVFVEYKSKNSINTVMSAIYTVTFLETNSSIRRTNEWLMESQIHWISNLIKPPALLSLKARNVDQYLTDFTYLRVNFLEYFLPNVPPVGKDVNFSLTVRYKDKSGQEGCVNVNCILISSYTSDIRFRKQDPIELKGYYNTVEKWRYNVQPFPYRGNDMEIMSHEDSIFVDYITDTSQTMITMNNGPNMKETPTFKYRLFEGDFMIGVSESIDKERTMHIYKCYQDIIMKETDQRRAQFKSYLPSLECKLIKSIAVSNLVFLVDANKLTDFLVVRYKSENSVVYYKIDLYDYNHVEINMRGYDPAMVWVQQLTSNTIILCHYKLSSYSPFAIYLLEGEALRKLPEPNVDQYRALPDLSFKAGSLIREGKNVFLYLAITTSSHVSFLKFNMTDTFKNPVLTQSAHDIFKREKNSQTELCFLKGRLFIVHQTVKEAPSLGEEPEKTLHAYLINLDNPNKDYSYPLKEFNITSMSSISVTCKPSLEIIILKGRLEEANNHTRISIYLNGSFTSANNRIIKKTTEKGAEGCDINFMDNYIIELCNNINNELGFIATFLRLKDPIINVKFNHSHSLVPFVLKAQQKEITVDIETRAVLNKKQDILDTNATEGFLYNIKKLMQAEVNESEKMDFEFDVLSEILNYTGHVVHAKIVNRSNPKSPLPKSSISLVERIEEIGRYEKSLDIENLDSESTKYGGFEKLVMKGDYLAVLSVITRYHALISWVIIYEFGRANGDLKIKYKFKINKVCGEFNFESYPSDGQVIIDLGIVCSSSIGSNCFTLYRFGLDTPNKEPSIIDSQITDSECSDVWEVNMNLKVKEGVEQKKSYQLSVLTTAHLDNTIRVYDFSSDDISNIYYKNKTNLVDVDSGFLFMFGNIEILIYLDSNRANLRYGVMNYDLKWEKMITGEVDGIPIKYRNRIIDDLVCTKGESNITKCLLKLGDDSFTTLELYYESSSSDNKQKIKARNFQEHMLMQDTTFLDCIMTDQFMVIDAIYISPGKNSLTNRKQKEVPILLRTSNTEKHSF